MPQASTAAARNRTIQRNPSPNLPPRVRHTPSLPKLFTPSAESLSSMDEQQRRGNRARSSSIVSVTEIKDTYDDTLDAALLQNINADWVNYKGAWLIHVVLIIVGKILVDIVPGMTQVMSWTIVLQGYLIICYIMFHYVTGTPFDANNGALDQLTLWEQIDHGAHYTPSKKWLTSLPIALFLLSTHYSRYDRHPKLFTLNFLSLLCLALAPKLPQMHRLRIRFFAEPSEAPNRSHNITPDSGLPTPITEEVELPTPVSPSVLNSRF